MALVLLATASIAQPPVAPTQPGVQPAAPPEFRLTPSQQAYLDQALDAWEKRSGEIRTFNCDFTRLVYDPVFGPGNLHKNEEDGAISYQKPDKGSFRIKEVRTWNAKQQKHVVNPNVVGEHWVCDGKSVFEYKHAQKQLVERPIPPEMQGKNIADGPLPFLFGAEADKLKARYWLRPDEKALEGTVWIVAAPKRQSDAANYRRVELMLDTQEFLPRAMRVTLPDNSWTVYKFDLATVSVNNRMTELWTSLFQAPKTPWGWKKIVEPAATAQAPTAPRR